MITVKFNGVEYEIEYGHNAVCAIEDVLGVENIMTVLKGAFKGKTSFRVMRAIIWAGMLGKRRGITLEDVGDIMDSDKNSFEVAQDAFAELYKSVMATLSVAKTDKTDAKN